MNISGGQTRTVTMQDAVGATGNGTVLPCMGVSDGAFTAAAFQVTGITTATITWEGTINGTNYVSILATNLTTGTEAATATANGIYRATVLGLTNVRARISDWTSGTITVVGVSCA